MSKFQNRIGRKVNETLVYKKVIEASLNEQEESNTKNQWADAQLEAKGRRRNLSTFAGDQNSMSD